MYRRHTRSTRTDPLVPSTTLCRSHGPEIRDGGWLNYLFLDEREADFWSRRFNRVWEGTVDSWGYPYQLSCWLAGGLAVVPRVNLVSNIGFGDDATHTTINTSYANMPNMATAFRPRHPTFIMSSSEATSVGKECVNTGQHRWESEF